MKERRVKEKRIFFFENKLTQLSSFIKISSKVITLESVLLCLLVNLLVSLVELVVGLIFELFLGLI